MDQNSFEVDTFADEVNFDWSEDAGAISQESQQSDYLRIEELPTLDQLFDLSFLDCSAAEQNEMKVEPFTPCSEVQSELFASAPVTPQLFDSPEAVKDHNEAFDFPVDAEDVNQMQQFDFTVEEIMVVSNEIPANDVLGGTVYHIPDAATPIEDLPFIYSGVKSISEAAYLVDDQMTESDVLYDTPTSVVSYCETTAEDDEMVPSPGTVSAADSTVGSTRSKPHASRVTATLRHARPGNASRGTSLFTDEYLSTVGTKEFNQRIQELRLSAEEAKRWKAKRRTLKNRGYAQSCRQKRVGRHREVDAENEGLRRELREKQAELDNAQLHCQQMRERIAGLEAIIAGERHWMPSED